MSLNVMRDNMDVIDRVVNRPLNPDSLLAAAMDEVSFQVYFVRWKLGLIGLEGAARPRYPSQEPPTPPLPPTFHDPSAAHVEVLKRRRGLGHKAD